jgi:hypothetical protein
VPLIATVDELNVCNAPSTDELNAGPLHVNVEPTVLELARNSNTPPEHNGALLLTLTSCGDNGFSKTKLNGFEVHPFNVTRISSYLPSGNKSITITPPPLLVSDLAPTATPL